MGIESNSQYTGSPLQNYNGVVQCDVRMLARLFHLGIEKSDGGFSNRYYQSSFIHPGPNSCCMGGCTLLLFQEHWSSSNDCKKCHGNIVWCLTKFMLTTNRDFDTALVMDKNSSVDIVSVW